MRSIIIAAVLALASPAIAQTAPQTPPPAPASNPAYAADVASMDSIIAALYASISGDAGVARDWDRFRNLFHPSAKLMPTATNPEGQGIIRILSPDDYIERAGPNLAQGFTEKEIARKAETFGRVSHVWSTYEGRRAAADAEPMVRGVNSIQLFDDGQRWWVISVYWQAETPTLHLPPEYLPPAS